MSHSDEDHGRLLFGTWQANPLLNQGKDADFRIVLVHHPWSFLADFDARDIETLIHRNVPPVRGTDSTQWYPREMLIDGLSEAVARWTQAGNRLLVTSRPYGLDGEQRRKLGLLNADISSLDEELQALLVRRWFLRLKEDRDLGSETAAAMLQHIRFERALHELAINPLLLTSMCIIYDLGKRLPHDKYLLYDRIVDTVLHKRYSGKENIDRIRGRLAAVALGMHTGEGLGQRREAPEAAASEHEIDRVLQTYHKLDGKTDQGLSDTVHVREDLLSQSGLLVSQGDGRASFYHLSIQEFLAAERLFVLHGQKQEELIDLFVARGQAASWRNTLGLLFGDLIDTFKPHAAVETLREFTRHIKLPQEETSQRPSSAGVWNQSIVLADCLQVLVGRESAIPDEISMFFQQCVRQAIEQEIGVNERQTLAVALGRLGDPRIEVNLRVDAPQVSHPGYVQIPADTYRVGQRNDPFTIERPFWLSTYPVTNSQFALFIRDSGYANPDLWSKKGWRWVRQQKIKEPALWGAQDYNAPNQPVVGVSWWEAEAFCRWAGGRLPTAKEAEAVARGPAGFEYPWGPKWKDGICNSAESGLGSTSAVGIFPQDRSPVCDAMDLAGNVFEWCADGDGAVRGFRGGSWYDPAGYCRSAYRDWYVPEYRLEALGFRVARSSA
jgi:formylglycine-generating enzyme required for sulfatase activity